MPERNRRWWLGGAAFVVLLLVALMFRVAALRSGGDEAAVVGDEIDEVEETGVGTAGPVSSMAIEAGIEERVRVLLGWQIDLFGGVSAAKLQGDMARWATQNALDATLAEIEDDQRLLDARAQLMEATNAGLIDYELMTSAPLTMRVEDAGPNRWVVEVWSATVVALGSDKLSGAELFPQIGFSLQQFAFVEQDGSLLLDSAGYVGEANEMRAPGAFIVEDTTVIGVDALAIRLEGHVPVNGRLDGG